MRTVVRRSLALIMAIMSLSFLATPAIAGPPIDLPRLPIGYDYGPPIESHGFWMPPAEGGEWRVVGSRFGEDRRLTLEIEVRPPAISVPLEAGPAVLFATLSLFGDAGGDIGAGARVPRLVARALPACPNPADCAFRGSITLPSQRLSRLAERNRAESWTAAVISLTLVRTFAQGTWVQVLPLYDERRDEPDGTVGRPLPISSRMLVLGAAPVGPRELWSRHDRAVLDRIDRLRREIGDQSRMPETQPLLIDIDTVACTYGWTIATGTGDTLVNVSRQGTSVPLRVDAPVGTEWIVSVPSIDRAQGIGEPPSPSEPFSSDVPGMLSGVASGDPYDCDGVEPGSIAWGPATAHEVAAFHEGDLDAILDTYATLPAGDRPTSASSAFERLWRPLKPEDIPFRYTCLAEVTFTTTDLATASRTGDVADSLAAVIEEVGPQISDDDADWFVVRRTDDLVLALAPMGSTVDDQLLDRTDAGWRFRTGGSPCTPRAMFGETSVGRWRLDPTFPVPGPKTRRLHVLGYLGCLGTQRAGKARIHLTNDAALVAIPMRSTVGPHFGECLGPTRMAVRLPEQLGDRTLYDAGSIPLRGATEELDIVRINASGSGG